MHPDGWARQELQEVALLERGNPIEEQNAIAAVLNDQEIEISLLSRRLAVLKRQKKGLMQQAVD